MSFKQKTFLKKSKVESELKRTLKIQIKDIKFEYQDRGSTGNVNKLIINDDQTYILKGVDNLDYFNFYKDYLQKYDLSHPEIHDAFQIEGKQFILMQCVNIVEKEWSKENYISAINWLAKKDIISSNNLNEIKKYPAVHRKINYLAELLNERFQIFEQIETSHSKIFNFIDFKKLRDLS